MTFIDFGEVKASHPIETLIDRLDLKMTRKGEQLRGPCPVCRSGGDRALVITPSKAAFFCFGAQTGGDVIALVSHTEGIGMKAAAQWISGDGERSDDRPDPGTVPNERKGSASGMGASSLKPLTYLDPAHAGLAKLNIAPETFTHFEAGYAPKGIMRGRLAIPIHDPDGTLIAYAGRAVSEEQSPTLIFPNGFEPEAHIFNVNRIGEGEFSLMRDPLAVLLAFEGGIENAVCFLTEAIAPEQLQLLAGLMEDRGCGGFEF